MTKEFLDTMDFVFKHENVVRNGKVVSENDPKDPGGLTKYGIDARSHPGVDIETLTKEQALEIYWQEWLSCAADKLPWPLSFAYFDAVVNTGKSQGVRFLQRVVNAKDDGILGPATLKAVSDALVPPGDAKQLALDLSKKRKEFYKKLVEKKPAFSRFIDGWNNRVTNSVTKIDPTV